MASNRPLDTNPRVGRLRIFSPDPSVGRYVASKFVETSGALETTNSSADALLIRIAPANPGKDCIEILVSLWSWTFLSTPLD